MEKLEINNINNFDFESEENKELIEQGKVFKNDFLFM